MTRSRFANTGTNGSGIVVQGFESPTIDVDILDNAAGDGNGFVDIDGSSILLATNDNSTINAHINDNTFQGTGIVGNGIFLLGDGGVSGSDNATFTLLAEIANNIISNQDIGIYLITRDTLSSLGNASVTLSNNTISTTGDIQESILLNSQETSILCANLTGNTVTTGGATYDDIAFFKQNTSQLQLPQASLAAVSAANNGATTINLAGALTFNTLCTTVP